MNQFFELRVIEHPDQVTITPKMMEDMGFDVANFSTSSVGILLDDANDREGNATNVAGDQLLNNKSDIDFSTPASSPFKYGFEPTKLR